MIIFERSLQQSSPELRFHLKKISNDKEKIVLHRCDLNIKKRNERKIAERAEDCIARWMKVTIQV
jgi:hypothetical protein